MFRKPYKEANEDIKEDDSLKKPTKEKTLSVKNLKTMYNASFRYAFIAIIICILISTLFLKIHGSNIYAIAEPEYPSKIGFDDIDEKRKRMEDIDEEFLEKLETFSLKSSSLVLSKGDNKKNRLYSPISLYMDLSMAAETADGDTQQEILQALDMDINMMRDETGKLFRRLYFYNEIGKLNLGNSLWLNENIDFNEEMLDLLKEKYYAGSYNIDFSNKEDAKKISKWVSNQTGGKLGNSFDDFALNQDDVMTLINTIYFYDEWIDRFDAKNTKEGEFYLGDGSKVMTDFMNMEYGSHGFVDAKCYTASYLSLKNNNRMVFILPDDGKTPSDIISNPEILGEALDCFSSDDYKTGRVIFKIPKFNFSSKESVKEFCIDLGIKDAFKEETADFSNLSDIKPLFISDIMQNSTISIDEKGVEAAAYTEITYAGAAEPDGIAEMILDRPFIFAITGIDASPLFVGIINNPNVE
jgi:serpin B